MQFTDADRQAFQYFDGVKTVYADALAIYRQILIHTRGKPNELTEKVFHIDPATAGPEQLMESWEAAEQLSALIRNLFKMQPFDEKTGQGARDEHCWAVWDHFCAYMAEQKKTPASSPSGSSPTVSPPASPALTPSTSASS